MKILIYTLTGTLKQQGTGPDAQVGDQVKLTLDNTINPDFNDYVLGVVQHPIVTSQCGTVTTYRIEYDPADIGGGITAISQAAVSDVFVLSGVDALALVVDQETQDRIAADEAEELARTTADGTLQDNIDAEASARALADGSLQDNIDAEASARETADGTLQDNIDAEASARALADGLLVPKTTTINSKALSGNITLTVSDIGAANATHEHGTADLNIPGPYANDGAAATGGVAVNDIYRVTGGTLAWRQV